MVMASHPISTFAQGISDTAISEESSESSSAEKGHSEEEASSTESAEASETGDKETPQYNDIGEPLDEKPDGNGSAPVDDESEDGGEDSQEGSDDKDGAVSDNKPSDGEDSDSEDSVSDNSGIVDADTVSDDAVVDAEASESVSGDTVSDDGLEGIGGNIEATFDFSDDYEISSTEDLPKAYSSVDAGIVLDPPATGSAANCWANTAAGLAETSMLKNNGSLNASVDRYDPMQVVRNFFNLYRTDRAGLTYFSDIKADEKRFRDVNILSVNGTVNVDDDSAALSQARGNLAWTTFELARWQGIKENNADFGDKDDLQEFDEVDTAAFLKNAYWVPNSDKVSIKKLIKQEGSVGLQIYLNASDDSKVSGTAPDGYGCRYFDNSVKSPNYTVQLVGWDDNFSKNNFTKKPGSDGAFLAKSPYEQSAELGGKYFWISYADAAFQYKDSARIAVAYDFTTHDTSTYFQYGYDGSNGDSTYSTKRVYTVFTAGEAGQQGGGSDKAEALKAVGVGVADAGTYEIGVYYYDSNATYLNQYAIETQTVKIPYTGFHTIELDRPVLLLKGDRVAISVKRTDGNAFRAFVDKKYTSKITSSNTSTTQITFNPYAVYGESYFNNPSTGKLISGNWALKSDIDPDQAEGTPTKSTEKKGAKYYVRYYERNYHEGMTPRVKMYTEQIDRPSLMDQTQIQIELAKYVWYYTGNNINPAPRVMLKNGGYLVTPDHYTTTYVNHKNAGIGAVVVRGGTVDSSGNVTKSPDVFSGEISEEFKIVSTQINISKCKIYGVTNQEYDVSGNYAQENVIVMYRVPETKHYVKLKQGLDYTVGSIEIENKKGTKATILITGTGAFRNSLKKKFKIMNVPKKDKNGNVVASKKASKISISDKSFDVTLINNGNVWDTVEKVPYDKSIKKYEPKVLVSRNGVNLQEGTDYKVTYKKTKNPGLAQVVIKGKGNYTGKNIAYFIIEPMRITTDAVIKMPSKEYKYTGNELKPKPRVTLYGKGIAGSNLYCHYNNNTGSSSGTATAQVIVFGKNKYIGYVGYTTFKITASTTTTK